MEIRNILEEGVLFNIRLNLEKILYLKIKICNNNQFILHSYNNN